MGWIFGIAFCMSLLWVWAMVDIHRRKDLSDDVSTMWFSFLLVGNLLAAIFYLVARVFGLILKQIRR